MRLQYPVKQGDYLGVVNVASVNNTIWNNLSSNDFKSSVSGSAIPSGLEFCDLSVYNSSNNDCYLKLRAKTADGDATTNELVILSGGMLAFNCLGFKEGYVETISYKKTATSDGLLFTCSFSRKDV